jgi:hypothetical protein
MNSIKTFQDLLDTKQRLESELATRRNEIQADVTQLKEDWRPVAGLISGIGKISVQSKMHPVLSMGISLVGNAIIRNMLPLRSGGIAQALMPVLTSGFSKLIYNKGGTSVFGNWLNRFKKRGSNGNRK